MSNIVLSWENIQPEKAKEYLEKNICNRPLQTLTVNRYAFDMQNNNWNADAIDPINFSCDGNLLNGQHRLNAVVKSGKTIKFLVARNVSEDAQKYMDRGKSKSFLDIYKKYYSWLTSKHVGVLNSVYDGDGHGNVGKLSDFEFGERLKLHQTALQDVVGWDTGAKRCHSALLAVVVRAYYVENHDRLKEFVKMVNPSTDRGIPVNSNEDKAALLLRNWMLDTSSRVVNGQSAKTDITKRTQKALYFFCRKKPLSRFVRFMEYYSLENRINVPQIIEEE